MSQSLLVLRDGASPLRRWKGRHQLQPHGTYHPW